jgi:hypothetical protein
MLSLVYLLSNYVNFFHILPIAANLEMGHMKTRSVVRKEKIVMFPDGRMDTANSAEYVGLSEKTMAMKRSDGTGPDFVKRGRVFYFKEDLDAWLKAGRVSSTARAAGAGR